MVTEVRVPTTGNAGEDAVVAELSASVGDHVAAGDVIAVLETAKASLEVEAPEAGVVLEIRCSVGDEIAEHSVLLLIGDSDEVPTSVTPQPTTPEPAIEPAPTPESAEPVSAPDTAPRTGFEPPTSPRARILAVRNGLNLADIQGSGPGGRIIVPDVLMKKAELKVEQVRATAPAVSPDSDSMGPFVTIPVRGARKVTATRMTQSLQDTAQVTLNRYVSAGIVQSFYQRLRAYRDGQGLQRISMSDLINFAVAKALPHHPAANSIFDWDGIRHYSEVHLGIAVDTGSALLVPVIRQAHTKTLSELSTATATLIDRARQGALESAEMAGGTFTVTNLGMFGVHWFTPVLNTPQSCILGVGAIHQPTADQPALLPLSFTFDHRALDGAAAARALSGIAEAIESIDVISSLDPHEQEQDLLK